MGKKTKGICRVCGAKQNMEETITWDVVDETIYSRFCPNKKHAKQMAENLVECPECGYTFINLGEQTDISKRWVKDKNYRMPFGETDECSYDAVKCYRTAMVFEMIGCRQTAIVWYLYAAILVEDEHRDKCLHQAFTLLQRKVKEDSTNFEICIAYLNVLRMLGVYESTITIGTPYKISFSGMERELVNAVLKLCEKKDKQYYTYFDMLLMQDSE